ncbi:hypothetical protein [uncultured Corynebacterium sp.]|uniref:hypothetical protein n=1 Tax=uncultured Corynebacterium sp. TaxID=159447 RepID=UPI0028048ED3|nr:hypothetical protein [uncultured Corynebacterium sp.]
MYTPIPGMSHLQLYVAPQRIRYEREPTAGDLATRDEIHGLVVIVLEVAAALRPMGHLNNPRFAPEIITHVRAWRKAHTALELRGGMALTSLHARANGEFFGSVLIGSHQRAFTGSAAGRHLRSFRLLSVGPSPSIAGGGRQAMGD